MIDDGRAYAVGLALKALLRKLEKKGVLQYTETQKMLDDTLEELKTIEMAPEEGARAARMIGALYLK